MSDAYTRIMARVIGAVAPRAALRWAAGRAALSSYIGAGGSDHNANWRPTRKSADAILRTDAAGLVARARSLDRNNVNVSGALRKIVSNVVHTGIRPQFTHSRTRAPLNDLEGSFNAWAKHNKFYVWQQGLALRHWWVDGEILGNLWIDPRRLLVGINPLRVEMLEQDLIDSNKNGVLANGHTMRRGMELDRHGDPVACWILSAHPGDYLYGTGLESARVELSRLVHLWLPLRASQTRGVSLMAPIVEEIRDLGEYKASERIAARLAAAFGLFIKTQHPELGAAMMPGGTQSQAPTVGDYLETGRIQTLPAGTEIQVAEASRPSSPYADYVRSANKDASVGFGLRYGNYSHDYTESSFSSERSAALDERRGWIGQQEFLTDGWCEPIARRWLEIEAATGRTDLRPEDVGINWQAPGWPWVDPVKDATANEKKLAMRVTTRRTICAEMGTDFDETLEQLAREEAEIASRVPQTQGEQNAPKK
ncbi:MAG: phage portal protein [Desulfomicrobium sp.]|nr:phage portal protein [Pseudomonadota bacterium]MBV1710757.1 phage portal protein [Desulfomicrobium sp.]MBU4570365.1 phage portal protein [Pseudomonadota bacterium]MBU4593286.1 phage portal protein [Pseudomonadota bacterium]MBV1719839.1 phage portal protein [Desulfomicrobium sp.]